MEGTRAGTATGSYKCGKPGHWLRDCPFSAPNSNFNLNPNPNSITATTPNPNTPNRSSSSFKPKSATKKPNMLPRTKPKLTPELLLSDDDLGYALRYFPRKFKYCGRGHEFVHKVEKVAATRRGKDMTTAAMRPCRDAISANSIPAFRKGNIPRVTSDHMKLHVKLGVPHPLQQNLDKDKISGQIMNFEVVDGGLVCSTEEMAEKNDDCYIVNAAVYVGY